MKPDYGPTVVMVVGAAALLVVLVAAFVMPLMASISARIAAVAS